MIISLFCFLGCYNFPMTESENESKFKVTARREGKPSGIKAKGIRRPNSSELPALRERALSRTRAAIVDQARDLPLGERISLPLQPHLQKHDNSCLLAASISIGEGLARHQGRLAAFNEAYLAGQARAQGLLSGAGMHTERTASRDAVQHFLERNLGIHINHLDPREPEEMGWAAVNIISEGNLFLLNSYSHWVAIYGLNKLSDRDINWLMVDPLASTLQQLSTTQLAERIIGTTLTGPSGSPGEIFVVEVPKPSFIVKSVRR